MVSSPFLTCTDEIGITIYMLTRMETLQSWRKHSGYSPKPAPADHCDTIDDVEEGELGDTGDAFRCWV